jgi:hypothetical protein
MPVGIIPTPNPTTVRARRPAKLGLTLNWSAHQSPHAICIVESSGIADRSRISVRRVNTDTESKTGAIVSWAAIISSTAVKRTTAAISIPAIEVSAEVSASRRRERVATAEVSAARRSKGASSANASCGPSSAIGGERRYRTEPPSQQ